MATLKCYTFVLSQKCNQLSLLLVLCLKNYHMFSLDLFFSITCLNNNLIWNILYPSHHTVIEISILIHKTLSSCLSLINLKAFACSTCLAITTLKPPKDMPKQPQLKPSTCTHTHPYKYVWKYDFKHFAAAAYSKPFKHTHSYRCH